MRYGGDHDFHMALRLPSDHHRALRRIAAARDISVSQLVREAVEIVVEAEAEPEPPTLYDNPFIRKARRRS